VRVVIKHPFSACLLLLIAACILFGTLATAYAQTGALEAERVSNQCRAIKADIISEDLDNAYLAEYLVTCVRTTIQSVFVEFINGFYPLVAAAGQAAMVLSVTIFGVLLVSGAIEKSSRDSFVLLFKLGCVLFFIQPERVEEIYGMGIDSMDSLTNIVYTFGKDQHSLRCYDNVTLWDRVDCMLDVIIGIVKEDELEAAGKSLNSGGGSVKVEGVSRGLMYFFFTNMTAGSMGFIIGVLGFYVMYTFLFALVKSIHTFLAAIIGLSFLLVFAPMFVPMIMFRVTRSYFDKWMRICISFVLQPVILFAFLSLMMIALDTMLISGENSFMKTVMGPTADSRNASPNEALDKQGAFDGKRRVGPYVQLSNSAYIKDPRVVDTGTLGKRVESASAEGLPNQLKNDGNFTGAQLPLDTVDYNKMVQCGSAENCMQKLGLSVLTIALTCFVFVSMLNYIPTMAADLSGGVYEVPNLFGEVGSKLPFMDQAQGMLKKSTAEMTEKIRPQVRQFSDEVGKLIGARR